MNRARKDIEAALRRKGFVESTGDHLFFTYHTLSGKKTRVFTKTSESHRDISDGIIGKMARSLKLSRAEFAQLVECTLSQQEYEKKLAALKLT